jgi:hypothetical protein
MASAGACMLLGCSKDLRHTNKIHGTWDITRIEAVSPSGTTLFSTDPDGVIQFDKCDVRPDDFRAYRHDYTYHHGDSTALVRAVGTYKFDDQGRQLVVRVPENGTEHETTYHVVVFEKKEIVMETRGGNGRTVYMLEKQ